MLHIHFVFKKWEEEFSGTRANRTNKDSPFSKQRPDITKCVTYIVSADGTNFQCLVSDQPVRGSYYNPSQQRTNDHFSLIKHHRVHRFFYFAADLTTHKHGLWETPNITRHFDMRVDYRCQSQTKELEKKQRPLRKGESPSRECSKQAKGRTSLHGPHLHSIPELLLGMLLDRIRRIFSLEERRHHFVHSPISGQERNPESKGMRCPSPRRSTLLGAEPGDSSFCQSQTGQRARQSCGMLLFQLSLRQQRL